MLGGLTADRVIATGESQSAGRMVTYINAVQPIENVYDGFMVHSRSGRWCALSACRCALGNPRYREQRSTGRVPILWALRPDYSVSPDRVVELYPTQADFTEMWSDAIDANVAGGFLLQVDGDELQAAANAWNFPN